MKFNNSIISKRTIQYLALLLILFLSLYLNISCEKGTEPEQLKPGRRDYVWTEDTLDVASYDYLLFRNIVGNTPDDIWLGTLDASYNTALWHYNGTIWKSIPFPSFAATALLLFEDNTLWAGTKQDYIYRYENGQLTESFKIELEGYDKIKIFDMSGETKDNIYAVGWASISGENNDKGIILHYDGKNWSFVNIQDLGFGFSWIVYQKNIKTYFIFGTNYENGIIDDQIFTFDGQIVEKIVSPYSSAALSKVKDIVYFNSSQKVFKYKNNNLTLWRDFSGTSFRSNFVGRSESDFFNSAYDGLGHYNGEDFKTIYKTHLELNGLVVFEKDVFAIAEDQNNHKYIILHGKLKE